MKKQRLLPAGALALLLATAGPARAADEAAWVGSVTLPALLERAAVMPVPVPSPTSTPARLLDPQARLPAACLAARPAALPALAPLLARAAAAAQSVLIAERFFAALAAEDEENIGTEQVAASHGRATKPAPDLNPQTQPGFELAYREAYSRREAARLAHRLARLQLGHSLGADKAPGEALDTQNLAWPVAPAATPEALQGRLLADNPRLRALALLQAQAPKSCRPALGQLITQQRQALSLAALEQQGRLRLALDSEQPAARQRLALAETGLDAAREALALSGSAGSALYAAEIDTAQAAAALQRVRERAVLADLRLQALRGLLPAPQLQD